jgi:hypothetical protein
MSKVEFVLAFLIISSQFELSDVKKLTGNSFLNPLTTSYSESTIPFNLSVDKRYMIPSAAVLTFDRDKSTICPLKNKELLDSSFTAMKLARCNDEEYSLAYFIS